MGFKYPFTVTFKCDNLKITTVGLSSVKSILLV